MNRFIKNTLEKFFPEVTLHLRAYNSLIRNKSSYLYLTGWMQSTKERKPIDGNGNPIPWMNFPVVKLLEERLTSDLTLFEFGSGYSTFFYANKVRAVTSVEYDENWFNVVKDSPHNFVSVRETYFVISLDTIFDI